MCTRSRRSKLHFLKISFGLEQNVWCFRNKINTTVAVNTNTNSHYHCRRLDRHGEDQWQPALSLYLLSRSPTFSMSLVVVREVGDTEVVELLMRRCLTPRSRSIPTPTRTATVGVWIDTEKTNDNLHSPSVFFLVLRRLRCRWLL